MSTPENEVAIRLRLLDQDRMHRGLVDTTDDVQDLGRAVERAGGKSANAARDISSMEPASGKARRALSMMSGQVDKTGRGLAGVVRGMTSYRALAATYIGASVLKRGTDYNKMIDSQNVSFTTLFRSQKRAKDFMAEIQQLALESPILDPKSTGDAARLLMAYGVSAKDALPYVKALGDMSAATGKDIGDVMPRAALALGQIGSKGSLQAEELNQLAESVGLSRKAIAKQLGMTSAAFEATFTSGKNIKASRALPAIIRAMEEQSGGAADRLAKTTQGKMARAQEQISKSLGTFTRPFYDEAGDVAGAIANMLQGKDYSKQAKQVLGVLKAVGGGVKDTAKFLHDNEWAAKGLAGALAVVAGLWTVNKVLNWASAIRNSAVATKALIPLMKSLGKRAGISIAEETAGSMATQLPGAMGRRGGSFKTSVGSSMRTAGRAGGTSLATSAANGAAEEMGGALTSRRERFRASGKTLGGLIGKGAGLAAAVGFEVAFLNWLDTSGMGDKILNKLLPNNPTVLPAPKPKQVGGDRSVPKVPAQVFNGPPGMTPPQPKEPKRRSRSANPASSAITNNSGSAAFRLPTMQMPSFGVRALPELSRPDQGSGSGGKTPIVVHAQMVMPNCDVLARSITRSDEDWDERK